MPPRTLPTSPTKPGDRRVVIALVYTAIAAVLLYRYGQVPALLARFPMAWRGTHIQTNVRLLWAALHVVCYGVVPLCVARACHVRVSDLGLRVGSTRRYLGVVALVTATGFLVLLFVSHNAGFLRAYPMYRPDRMDVVGSFVWLVVLGAYLFSIELYFRGFLLAMLTPALGSRALFVALVPYVASHSFLPETLGSIPVGLLLGVLRRRSGSLWPGYIAHFLVAVQIELFARWRHGFW